MAERVSDPNTTRSKARARRGMILALWWGVVLIGLFAATSGGPWILLFPVVLIGIIVGSNTIVVIRGTGAEQQALAPGRLARADTDDNGVIVSATRSPRRGASDRARRTGSLMYERGRLRFSYHESAQERAVRSTPTEDEVVVFDTAPRDIVLGPRPRLLRPALELTIDATTHLLEFTPPMDLGAGAVGAVVAAAWYDQLLGCGARTGASAR